MTDLDWMQLNGYKPDQDQLTDFIERVGVKMDSGISEDDARQQATEGR